MHTLSDDPTMAVAADPVATDQALLDAYVNDGCQRSFTRLVNRYGGLVYSAAYRQVRNSTLAEDVMQAVFLLLAFKANKIRDARVLPRWLFTTTRYAAANVIKIEGRRRKHERRAAGFLPVSYEDAALQPPPWEDLSVVLDDAIGKLGKSEQDVILLRYFGGKSMSEVGADLGISEDAAKKRASRAMEKLRGYFAREGFAVPALSLDVLLLRKLVLPPPYGLSEFVGRTATAAVRGMDIAIGPATIMQGAIERMWVTQAKALGTMCGAAAAAMVVVMAVGSLGAQALERASREVQQERPRVVVVEQR
jgi:RNA polymerase sigma factor (sigma-70 family)